MIDLCIRKRQRKNGTTVYEYRFEIASIDGQRKWKTKCGFKTKTEAQIAGKAALKQYENFGSVIEKDAISYSDFLDYWLANDCEVDLNPVTLYNYKKKVQNIIKPKLGKYRLKSITREILQAFIIAIYDEGYSYNTLTSIKGILTKSFNYAQDHHYIIFSPAVRLKTPKHRVPKIPTRSSPHHFIKPDIMQKIFERFPEKSSSYIPLKLGYECGLRIGEIFGLCWEDIDFENRLININRQIQWYTDTERAIIDKIEKNGTSECGKGYWYYSPPKYKSYRKLEISDELTELLHRERERQLKSKEYYATYYVNYFSDKPLQFDGQEPEYTISVNKISKADEGFLIQPICVRECGSLITPRAMHHTTQIVKKEISTEFDFHSLRHTHASMLAEIGVEQKYIQTRLGHSNLDITIEVYEHITDKMRARGRKVLNEMFT